MTVHKCAETIQGRKLFKGGNYMRKYGNYAQQARAKAAYSSMDFSSSIQKYCAANAHKFPLAKT